MNDKKLNGKKFRTLIFFPLILATVSLAITQEAPLEQEGEQAGNEVTGFEALAETEQGAPATPAEPLPDWVKPERWFKSSSSGMALQEVGSRFAALRNKYALVIDFISPDELPELLSPFYKKGYYIEVHALFENGQESRKQWIFRDENGISRLVSVFNGGKAGEAKTPGNGASKGQESAPLAETVEAAAGNSANAQKAAPDEAAASSFHELNGFIEIYNENYMLEKEILFSKDTAERQTDYFYRREVLVRSESRQDGKHIYTDNYRYNRSGSLRAVERLYHDKVDEAFVRLSFPNRVLDAASEERFMGDKLYMVIGSFGSYEANAGQRMVFTTDDRGRILTQSLLDEEGEEIWVIKNTWADDRIASALKIEGEDERLNEYSYNASGDLIRERNYRNGILERQVFIKGDHETEELIMGGVVVLRAEWESGRKLSEQRVKSGEKVQ